MGIKARTQPSSRPEGVLHNGSPHFLGQLSWRSCPFQGATTPQRPHPSETLVICSPWAGRISYRPHAPVSLAVTGSWAQVGRQVAGQNRIVNSQGYGTRSRAARPIGPTRLAQLLQFTCRVKGFLGVILVNDAGAELKDIEY
jgi:hypothetical protein